MKGKLQQQQSNLVDNNRLHNESNIAPKNILQEYDELAKPKKDNNLKINKMF